MVWEGGHPAKPPSSLKQRQRARWQIYGRSTNSLPEFYGVATSRQACGGLYFRIFGSATHPQYVHDAPETLQEAKKQDEVVGGHRVQLSQPADLFPNPVGASEPLGPGFSLSQPAKGLPVRRAGQQQRQRGDDRTSSVQRRRGCLPVPEKCLARKASAGIGSKRLCFSCSWAKPPTCQLVNVSP